jgi:YD repeat-containing protein
VVQPLQLTAQFCGPIGDHCGSSGASGGTGLDDGGMGSVNFGPGNLMLKIGQVSGGAFSPVPQAAYNAAAANSSNLGYGWSGLFIQQIATVDASTVNVTKGSGTVLRYTNKDVNGKYLAPGGAQNSLVKNGDGTWTETQPDGFQLVYDSTGKLSRMVNPAGARFSHSYDGSGKLTNITDPAGGRTTFAYDVS